MIRSNRERIPGTSRPRPKPNAGIANVEVDVELAWIEVCRNSSTSAHNSHMSVAAGVNESVRCAIGEGSRCSGIRLHRNVDLGTLVVMLTQGNVGDRVAVIG